MERGWPGDQWGLIFLTLVELLCFVLLFAIVLFDLLRLKDVLKGSPINFDFCEECWSNADIIIGSHWRNFPWIVALLLLTLNHRNLRKLRAKFGVT